MWLLGDKEFWFKVGTKFGVPTLFALLFAAMFGIASSWVAEHVLQPTVERHFRWMDWQFEQGEAQAKTLEKINDSQVEQVRILRGIGDEQKRSTEEIKKAVEMIKRQE